VSRSCGVTAVVCLLLFLVAAPSLIREQDRIYQQNVAFALARQKHAETYRAAYAAIRSDPIQVKQLEATIEGYIQESDADIDRRLAEEGQQTLVDPE
jgi:hypothetical protein